MYRVKRQITPVCLVEADGANPAEVFEHLAALEEIFSFSTCGKCGSTEIRYQVRQDKEGHKYHQAACRNPDCRAEFRFGLKTDKVTLFPQLKYPTDAPKGKQPHPRAGEWKEDGGWEIWQPTGQDAPAQRPAPATASAPPPKVKSAIEVAGDLDNYDVKLAGEGLFTKGQLVDAVTDACAKGGYGRDPLKWGPEAHDMARKATKVFVDRCRAAKAK